jgi:hypothetical protein
VTIIIIHRIAKLETIAAPPPPIPNVLRVRRSETTADAIRRFTATYPNPPRRHCLLIVPERDTTAEDDADFEAKFAAQQLKSQADARSAKPKDQRI